jgi:high-affinity Fe2+/Pb2+ permease
MNGAPGDEVDLAANIVLIVAAVLAILVVRGVTARQDRKNELITNGGLV